MSKLLFSIKSYFYSTLYQDRYNTYKAHYSSTKVPKSKVQTDSRIQMEGPLTRLCIGGISFWIYSTRKNTGYCLILRGEKLEHSRFSAMLIHLQQLSVTWHFFLITDMVFESAIREAQKPIQVELNWRPYDFPLHYPLYNSCYPRHFTSFDWALSVLLKNDSHTSVSQRYATLIQKWLWNLVRTVQLIKF